MATIKDVARLAGVSTTTVSHVINKTRFVAGLRLDHGHNNAPRWRRAPHQRTVQRVEAVGEEVIV